MKKRTIIPAILFATVLILTSCSKDDEEEETRSYSAPKCEITLTGETVNFGDTIVVNASVTENAKYVFTARLYLDDKQVLQTKEKQVSYEIKTGNLSAGIHTVKFTAIDVRDSVGIAEKTFELEAGEPVVINTEVGKVGTDSATFYGELESTGGLPSTWGVCYNTTGNPQKEDRSIEVSDSVFAVKLTGLTKTTTYSVRTWVSNEKGTFYGKEIGFKTTDELGVLFDARDNRKYRWVKIGNQTWMAENLAYLPYVTPISKNSESDSSISIVGYEGEDVSVAKQHVSYSIYGVLYSWKVATEICPSGWHLPDTNEWKEMVDYLGGEDVAGGKLKTRGTEYWNDPNRGATNESGFNALPTGYSGKDMGEFAEFWYESDLSPNWPKINNVVVLGAHSVSINLDGGPLNKYSTLPVRCVKD